MSAHAQTIAELHQGVAQYRGNREHMVAFTVPAPVRDPLRLLAAATSSSSPVGRDVPALFWDEASSPTWVGLGTAFSRSVTSNRGVLHLQAEFVDRMRAVQTVHLGARLPWPVRAFGGLAFEHEVPEASDWAAFGAGYFTIPRWSYVRGLDEAWLMVVLQGTGGPLAEQTEAVRREAEVWLEALDTPWTPQPPVHVQAERPGRQRWSESVDTIRERVHQDLVGKAVLTRDTFVRARGPNARFDVASSLSRLAHEPTGSARFAFAPLGRGGPAFIGLTPERLVHLFEHELVTEALAGTAPDRPDDADPGELMASVKDREEHLHVVRFIMDRLGPLCAQLEHGPPRIRSLRHVTHLKTPITGRLSALLHVLDVVKALHPTPATGGVPLGAARALIKKLEGRPRGWYTGPVGWFDTEGNGDFWVALRSGLLLDDQARVFVGAGIVRDSDAEVEWQETLLKERALMSGLGVID